MTNIRLRHLNLNGTRTIGGYSTAFLDERFGYDLEMLPSGCILCSKPGEAFLISPSAWNGAELMDPPVAIQVAPSAAAPAAPILHLNSDGETALQPLNETMGKPRKQPKKMSER